MTSENPAQTQRRARSRSPELIILAGCLIALLTFGPRSAIGIFQLPVLSEFGWGSDVFSFAMAVQYLLWGIGQPFAGAMADRYGSARVFIVGALLYALGLWLMSVSTTPLALTLSAGVVIGFGLSAASFNLVIGAFSKLVPPHRQPLAFGLGTAAGSFGQFLFSPLAGALVGGVGWKMTLLIFGGTVLLVIPLAMMVATRPLTESDEAGVVQQSLMQAMREAFSHRSYVLLVIGFFTCGFQLAFVTIHFQKYVVEAGLEPHVGYWAFALVGIFNVVGSMSSGYFGAYLPQRYILSFIYFSRAIVTLAFIMLPASALSAYIFGAMSGLLWLSTVPPTSTLIGIMFGTRYFSTLYGFAFLSHQAGGFIGLVLAGVMREQTGSYAAVWWLSIGLGVASALINLPIVEKPVDRSVPVPA